jgi:hypothetical protein
MSHVVPQTTTSTRRIHLGRRHLAALVALAAIVATLWIVLIASTNDSQQVQRSTPSAQVGGPNEDARGAAAATAAGVPPAPSLGGPDENARGQAVHSAAR